MRLRFTVLAAAAVAALAPASADAATVRVHPTAIPSIAFYDAAPGEQNDLTVTYNAPSRGEVTVHDTGAVIRAVAPCESVDEHTAHCPPVAVPEGYPGFAAIDPVEVRLGDEDDHLTTDSGPEFPFGSIVAHGGKGDDVLDGDKGNDRLDGGAGADRLSGGEGIDLLSDGDRTGQNPQPDVLDGGTGGVYAEGDSVEYGHRTAGVTVDLANGVGGEPGEGDTLTGLESASGGRGDDRLTDGGRETTYLYGDAGDDILTGGPGFNVLMGGNGDDTVVSGPYGNQIEGGPGLDAYRCSGGEDRIMYPTPGELLGPLCDQVDYALLEFDSFRFSPHPVRTTRRAVWFRTGCPSHDNEAGDFIPCKAVVKLRGGRGKRVLGRGVFEQQKPAYPRPNPAVRVALTGVGRRLAARRNGVVVTVVFHELTAQTDVAWTIRLKTKP